MLEKYFFDVRKVHNIGGVVQKNALFSSFYLRNSIKMCYFAPAKPHFWVGIS